MADEDFTDESIPTVQEIAAQLVDAAERFRDLPADANVRDALVVLTEILTKATMIGSTITDTPPAIFLGMIAGSFLELDIQAAGITQMANDLLGGIPTKPKDGDDA